MRLVKKIIFLILCSQSLQAYAGMEEACKGINHPAHQNEYRACLRLQVAKYAKEEDVDCESCLFEQEGPTKSNFMEFAEAALPALMQAGSSIALSKLQNDFQTDMANEVANGYKACTARFNTLLDTSTTNGTNTILPSEAMSFSNSCNGYGYGSYAGFGGMTSNNGITFGNPFSAFGFSPGFMSGYNGMYNVSNGSTGSIYNSGMLSGSMGVAGTLTTDTTGVTSGFAFN